MSSEQPEANSGLGLLVCIIPVDSSHDAEICSNILLAKPWKEVLVDNIPWHWLGSLGVALQ